MPAGKYSFTIEQGATLSTQIQWSDTTGSAVNLTGYQARMQIRPDVESTTVYLSLSSSLQPDRTGLNLNGVSGNIPFSSGSIGLYISAATSSLLNFDTAVYDLELISGSIVTRLLEGKVKLSKNVTR